MAHVIAEPCIGTKDTACVEVCPVDCIHEAGDGSSPQLYIDPAECIDCAACVPACPVDAIFAEADLPAKWAKFTQINADFFAGGGAAAPAAAAAGGAPAQAAKEAAPKKKAAPEPEPLPEPLALSPEQMYKSLDELREDVAPNRGRAAGEEGRRSPVLVAAAAAVVLLFIYGISNNFSKAVNTSVYGRLGAAVVAGQKPTLTGSVFTMNREIDGKRYVVKVSDSIFGGRTLTLQVPAEPFDSIYHQDEKYFDDATNQYSRFYVIYVDQNSDGKLDSVLRVREIWSSENRLIGRYHRPLAPTARDQAAYEETAAALAHRLGLAERGA